MIEAAAFISEATKHGFDFYTGVPCSFLTPLINRVLSDRSIVYVGAASEGEAVAIAFKGRPRTIFIGTATRGLSSSNEGFLLSDGANLVITVGLDVDRTGTVYEERVLPDEVVEGPREPDGEAEQLARAMDWLSEQE